MPFDPSKISIRKSRRAKEIDPERIFESLTLRGTVENLWSPQAAALTGGHRQRSASDVVIDMNTGGGNQRLGVSRLMPRIAVASPECGSVRQALREW